MSNSSVSAWLERMQAKLQEGRAVVDGINALGLPRIEEASLPEVLAFRKACGLDGSAEGKDLEEAARRHIAQANFVADASLQVVLGFLGLSERVLSEAAQRGSKHVVASSDFWSVRIQEVGFLRGTFAVGTLNELPADHALCAALPPDDRCTLIAAGVILGTPRRELKPPLQGPEGPISLWGTLQPRAWYSVSAAAELTRAWRRQHDSSERRRLQEEASRRLEEEERRKSEEESRPEAVIARLQAKVAQLEALQVAK